MQTSEIVSLVRLLKESPNSTTEMSTKSLIGICEEILALQKRDDFLSALEMAGVNNWEGYSHAHEILGEEF